MSTIKRDDGGPAFPSPGGEHPGMSLRDWLAGQAMASFTRNREAEMFNDQTMQWHAKIAYQLADAMLLERGHDGSLPIPKPRSADGQGRRIWQPVGAHAH